VFSIFVILVLSFWAIAHWANKFDEDGAVKKVAKQGLINVISRWMK
jgi:hypothetical protein